MPISRIIFFTIALLLLRTGAVAAVVVANGIPTAGDSIPAGYIAATAISAFLFTGMSVIYPAKAFRNAIVVGIAAYILGVLATALLAVEILWEPASLLLDSIGYLVAIFLGVSLGTWIGRNATAS